MFKNSTQNIKPLLQKVAEGNENAFGKLFKTYDVQVNNYILSLTRSEPLTQEMVQDVFLKIWMNRSLLTEIKSFEPYLFIIARNHTYDCLKKISRKKKRENEWMSRVVVSHYSNNHNDSESDNSHEKIQEAVSMLPPQQKKIYFLRRDGMKHAEIAQQLSLSIGTVKKHLVLANRFLKNQLRARILVN